MSANGFSMDHARAEAILAERAARLAKGSGRGAGAEAARPEFLGLTAGGRCFALPLSMAASVMPGTALPALPVDDAAVVGAVHHQGEIRVVFALAELAGLSAGTPDSGAGHFVVLRDTGVPAALAVDGVEGFVRIDTTARSGSEAPDGAADVIAPEMATDGRVIIDRSALIGRLQRLLRRRE